MRARSLFALFIPLCVAAAACREVAAPNEDPATARYATTLGVNLSQMTRTASGLYIQDLTTGTGTVADSGKTIRTYYTGWLSSGQEFDSNRGETPREFKLGDGSVIKGWDEGILGMRVNGRRRLVIPPALGYGGATNGLIPAGSVLVFDIELVAVN